MEDPEDLETMAQTKSGPQQSLSVRTAGWVAVKELGFNRLNRDRYGNFV